MHKVYDWIQTHAARRPERLAILDYATGHRVSYGEMHERVAQAAGVLRDKGVGKGDRVAVLSLNSPTLFEIEFACARVGAIFCPLNIRLSAPELLFILNDLEPSLVLADTTFHEMAVPLAEEVSAPLMGIEGLGVDTEWSTACAAAMPVHDMVDLTHDDDWIIIYTSGTTGRPKGARLTHGMVFAHAVNVGAVTSLTPRSVNLCLLPFFHTSGLNVFANPTFHIGGANVVTRSVDPAQILDIIDDKDLGVSHFIGVPTIFQFMAEKPAFETTDYSRLEGVMVGGAPAPEALLRRCASVGLEVAQAYGMTESGPGVLVLDKEDAQQRIGSSGKPLMHVDVRLVRQDGTDAGQDEVAEIWLQGPSITPGYWRRPEANKNDYSDGWFKTGDAAYRDADGFYYIVDRWKDMYISGGENVYPAEVENVISNLDGVLQVAVIGVPDDKWGETGCACIVLRENATLGEDDIRNACAANLARYKHPRDIVFLDTLPQNATGKIQKRELRDQILRASA
ncbi:long-chain fatty acid--CoA ligase [Lutimaribacter marinistellae]|uniref:Long-chain fatty acid--CoA ligase n=1 Tax=Lutimaribacter marinistellae TaxID=1820329 RepID=A0ABV7TC70_9RHOB